MKKEKVVHKIEQTFRNKVRNDKTVRNAMLMVHSEKLNVYLKIAEGNTGSTPAHPDQPVYMASVGKLFTSTLIAILFEKGKLSFNDTISKFLDPAMVKGLHIYKGTDYSEALQIRHLLNHTSGLPDSFWPLLERVVKEPDYTITPLQALEWTKTQAKPAFAPGKGFKYTDTNYHLLGLIIEKITGMKFHEALSFYFFEPLGMKNTWAHYRSEPAEPSPYPMADFYWKNTRMNDFKAYAGLDYAGGAVVAPSDDLLKFLKALAKGQIVAPETLQIMKDDKARFGLGIDYGYGIWQFKTVPVFMPRSLNCWGVTGGTGAFLFYHPKTDSYIVGSFNQSFWASKAIRFMLLNVIRQLVKIKIILQDKYFNQNNKLLTIIR